MTPMQRLMHINLTNIDRLIYLTDDVDELTHLAGQAYELVSHADYTPHLSLVLTRRAHATHKAATRKRVKLIQHSDLAAFI